MSAVREISSVLLPPTLRRKLLDAGYTTVDDIDWDMKPTELAKDIGCSFSDARHILKQVKGSGEPVGKSALELLESEQQQQPVVTFCQQMDEMFGGGIPIGKITEFCGVPGIGKTQLGIQLAVDVHIPEDQGGAAGHCIYVDTEGSFVPERAAEMAEALVEVLRHSAESRVEERVANGELGQDQLADEIGRVLSLLPTTESILSSIHYYRVHDYVEQIALVNILPSLLQEDPLIKLIVVDSIAFHFRHDFENMSVRTRLLNNMAQSLLEIAEGRKVAVVLMNQVTTKISSTAAATLAPALGESWGHTCTNRVILYWKDGCRNAHLYKSPSQEATTGSALSSLQHSFIQKPTNLISSLSLSQSLSLSLSDDRQLATR